MKYLTLMFCLICFSDFVYSQESLEKFIELVKQNNKTLKAAELKYNVEIANSTTNLNPENPEIEIGYLIGNPKEVGNRTDFAISQSFDFPTSYIQKKKVSKILSKKAGYSKHISEQQIILETKRTWLNQVYLNKLLLIISKRINFAEQLYKQYEKKLVLGEINLITLNKISLRLSLLRNEYDKTELELHKNKYHIYELCNDTTILINDTIFPINVNIEHDSIINLYESNPTKKYFHENIRLKQQQSKLAFSERLPKIKIGYYSERIETENFKGAKIGFSIPLWENKNKTKQAKYDILLAEAELDNLETIQNSNVEQLLEQKEHLNKQKNELAESLNKMNDMRLLRKALNSGEISLSEYYFESDIYFRAIIELIEIQKEELLIEYDLLKVTE